MPRQAAIDANDVIRRDGDDEGDLHASFLDCHCSLDVRMTFVIEDFEIFKCVVEDALGSKACS